MLKNKKSFTLAEILIVIIVFGVWIIAILQTVMNNIMLVENVKNKTTATFLAKEWIEIIYNIRNLNYERWLKWNCTNYNNTWNLNELCNNDNIFSTWNTYTVSINSWWYYTIEKNNLNNRIYYHTGEIKRWNISVWKNWFWYNHNPTDWVATNFGRTISFTWVFLAPEDNIWSNDKIMKVMSIVNYWTWAYTWNVILESFIWDIRK